MNNVAAALIAVFAYVAEEKRFEDVFRARIVGRDIVCRAARDRLRQCARHEVEDTSVVAFTILGRAAYAERLTSLARHRRTPRM